MLGFACFQDVDACLTRKLHGGMEGPQVMLWSRFGHYLCDDPTANISIMLLATAAYCDEHDRMSKCAVKCPNTECRCRACMVQLQKHRRLSPALTPAATHRCRMQLKIVGRSQGASGASSPCQTQAQQTSALSYRCCRSAEALQPKRTPIKTRNTGKNLLTWGSVCRGCSWGCRPRFHIRIGWCSGGVCEFDRRRGSSMRLGGGRRQLRAGGDQRLVRLFPGNTEQQTCQHLQ